MNHDAEMLKGLISRIIDEHKAACRKHPDFLEWYQKEKAKNAVNSYESQIEILKAKIANVKG